MMAIKASKRARTLPDLPLSLYEQLAHIPRELEANLVGNLARISRSFCGKH
ncbi:hypothetical protein [Rhodoferax saidenbachensis]|uniref:Uncharacterized protein n=1 Tax=Rhodoferax saidenbachensis TaxID=1484693 RepID=A0ABU1ZJG2_9BURK|nr:hypothetical protein [Rhodoferax saidenbachensis]MDR7305685.1 hypothetical protein [Rhodoferax saidenbachensis]